MKELNKTLDKISKNCPHVTGKIKQYGKGRVIQVIISDKSSKIFEIKENKEPGLYKTDKKDYLLLEILYSNNKERKTYIKRLIEIFKEELNNHIVLISCISETKETMLIQLYVLDEINKFFF